MSYGINEATGRRKDNTKVNSDGYAVLHTQEVTGSSPVVSTTKQEPVRRTDFYFHVIKYAVQSNSVFYKPLFLCYY